MGTIFASLFLLLSQLPVFYSTSPHRGNCRPIRFEPPMLDFHEQWVSYIWNNLCLLCDLGFCSDIFEVFFYLSCKKKLNPKCSLQMLSKHVMIYLSMTCQLKRPLKGTDLSLSTINRFLRKHCSHLWNALNKTTYSLAGEPAPSFTLTGLIRLHSILTVCAHPCSVTRVCISPPSEWQQPKV